ncbi:TIGD4 [Branchiostoma lanceolatum]|uniref:TIGD4 protein n=1 Tax=Branchiostoma lanceolatum TaxID=7740 RepID=A0A8J9YYP6_BRALA|nr:TIGD4 [Branchiostoma lanceolatum]
MASESCARSKVLKKTLTLGQKIEVIRRYEKGGTGARAIALDFGVGKTQIQNIVKRKREYLEDYEKNAPINKKRNTRLSANEDINKLCWHYFCETSTRPVTGPMLQQQALKFAEQLGVVGFKASNGWLESFKNRHNIAIGAKITGVSGAVAKDWPDRIADITAGYSAEDIYNLDESGLFFRTTSNQTVLPVKGDHSYFSREKQAQDSLTILLCVNMAGEKERPLVIGQAARPPCFKNVQLSSLPVSYAHNKMAWMTSELFLDWLRTFDRKMGSQDRKVLLFLDHAPSHPHVRYRNVELVFFPPSTTSRYQPLGQGVIHSFKLNYRKRQLRRVLQERQKHREASGEQLAREVSVLEAVQWVSSAWQEVPQRTIQTCFRKAGFVWRMSGIAEPEEDTGEAEDLTYNRDPAGADQLTQELFGCKFDELSLIDRDLPTCDLEGRDWDEDATILLDELQEETREGSDNDNEEDTTDNINNREESSVVDKDKATSNTEARDAEPHKDNPIKDLNTLVELMKHIKHFCAEEGLGDLLNSFHHADEMLNSIWSERQGAADIDQN